MGMENETMFENPSQDLGINLRQHEVYPHKVYIFAYLSIYHDNVYRIILRSRGGKQSALKNLSCTNSSVLVNDCCTQHFNFIACEESGRFSPILPVSPLCDDKGITLYGKIMVDIEAAKCTTEFRR